MQNRIQEFFITVGKLHSDHKRFQHTREIEKTRPKHNEPLARHGAVVTKTYDY